MHLELAIEPIEEEEDEEEVEEEKDSRKVISGSKLLLQAPSKK